MSRRVLVVEDDADTADYIIKGLREEGFTVEHAADGRDGLYMASSSDFDAVVMDRMVPGMDGLAVVKALRARGVKVVDLSADFRLRDLETYEQWYVEHPAPELIETAVYGLPELYREQIAGADLVANPGCYPTAALLALAPLAREGLIGGVVIDAKSGVSGAGRAATDKTHFVAVDENVNAYGVPRHRHTPEIEQELAVLGSDTKITFTPHLLPLDQGELVSCYVSLSDATVSILRLCSAQKRTRSGTRAMVPSSFITSQMTPAGMNPAMRARSTEASVCPARTSTPPLRARSGKTCPGRAKSFAVDAGSIATRIVCARSAAEMPVVTPSRASMDSVNAVPKREVLSEVIGARRR